MFLRITVLFLFQCFEHLLGRYGQILDPYFDGIVMAGAAGSAGALDSADTFVLMMFPRVSTC